MGKGWGRIVLFTMAMVFGMCGCQRGEEKEEAATGAPTVWEEEWKVALDSGEDITADMRCDIGVGENQPDSIVEAQPLEINSQNKEALAKGAFGGEVYLFDPENMCEADLQKRLSREERVLKKGYGQLEYLQENYPDVVSDYRKKTIAELKGRVDKIKRLLKDAPKEPVLAQDGAYDSDSYMGYIDGVAYRLEFSLSPVIRGNKAYARSDNTWWRDWDTINLPSNIELCPIDMGSFAPEELREVEEIENRDFYADDKNFMNACSLSEEEAEEKALEMLKRLGFTNMAKVIARPLGWRDSDDDSGYGSVKDGYVFYFQTEVGGNILHVFEDEFREELPYGKEEVQVQINDKGVVKVVINYPVQVENITPDVKLLEFKDVKDVLKTQLPDYISMYMEAYEKWVEEKPSVGNFRGTYLQLLYGRISDPEDAWHFTYVPVWELTGYFDRVNLARFYINAIDGSYVTLDFGGR